MQATVSNEKVTRRSFVGYVIAALGAFIGTVLGAASAIFAASPALTQEKGEEFTLGLAASFEVGVPKLIDLRMTVKDGWVVEETTRSVWVLRTDQDRFLTYNPKCTHLGCIVSWVPSQKVFRSPCHGGIFSPEGDVLAGPPPRPLDRLENRVENGRLIVQYREFRLGVPEKVDA